MTAPSIRAALPNSSTSDSAFSGVASVPARSATVASSTSIAGVSRTGHSWVPSRATAWRDPGDGVVGVDHRAVAGAAARRQPHPGHALLGGLDEVDPLPAHGGAEAADLADRLGHAVEVVGVLLDHDLRAVVAPGLLVGGERQHDRPLRHRAGAGARPDDREQHRVEVLHVDRAAAPHEAVLDLAGERVDLPVLGGRRARRRGGRAAAARPPAILTRPSGRSGWSGPASARRPSTRSRPRRAAWRRARPPCAPPARSRRRSWRCRSGSGRGTARRPRSWGRTTGGLASVRHPPILHAFGRSRPDAGSDTFLC